MYLVVKRGVSVLVVLLAVLGLVACQTSDSSTESTRLFVVEAGQGEFSATADEDIFQLTTRAHKADVVWFDDRPSVDTGIETLDQFFDRIWPRYFAIFPPSVALVMRTSDGEWLLSSAQVLSMTQPQSGEAIWTLKMENRLDFQPLDRVLIYLDNEGGLLPANETHTFMQAAAEGAFVAINDTDYALELRAPMDTLMMLAVTPNYDSQLIENSLFVNELWQGFIAAPPNAAVTIADAQGAVTTHIVTLSQPSWDAHNQRFRYRVTPLSGALPSQSGPTFVYIDAWVDDGDDRRYGVVVNEEEIYSIWLADYEPPLGWQWVGFEGSKQECLDYVERVWVDMRPLSLRKKMEEMEKQAR